MQPRGNTVLQDAEQLLRERRLDEARVLLAEYVQKNPGSARGWWLLSFAVTDPARQIECLERVLQIDPNNAATHARLAKLKGGPSPFVIEKSMDPQSARSISTLTSTKKKTNWALPVSILSIFVCLSLGIVGLVMMMKDRQQAVTQPTQSPLIPAQTPTFLGLPPT